MANRCCVTTGQVLTAVCGVSGVVDCQQPPDLVVTDLGGIDVGWTEFTAYFADTGDVVTIPAGSFTLPPGALPAGLGDVCVYVDQAGVASALPGPGDNTDPSLVRIGELFVNGPSQQILGTRTVPHMATSSVGDRQTPPTIADLLIAGSDANLSLSSSSAVAEGEGQGYSVDPVFHWAANIPPQGPLVMVLNYQAAPMTELALQAVKEWDDGGVRTALNVNRFTGFAVHYELAGNRFYYTLSTLNVTLMLDAKTEYQDISNYDVSGIPVRAALVGFGVIGEAATDFSDSNLALFSNRSAVLRAG